MIKLVYTIYKDKSFNVSKYQMIEPYKGGIYFPITIFLVYYENIFDTIFFQIEEKNYSYNDNIYFLHQFSSPTFVFQLKKTI